MTLRVAVLIPAAGSSSRFGGKKPKQFTDLDGRAVFIRTIEAFAERDDVARIVIAIPEHEHEMYEIKWGAKLDFYGVKTIIGAEQRWQTVQKLLESVKDESFDLIAVHDAARPCVTNEIIDNVFKAAVEYGAAIPACRLVGTIKRSDDDGNIAETVDRSELWEAQTPQTFKPELIYKAYQNITAEHEGVTDDAQLLEAMGEKVRLVESDTSNLKITHGIDMAYASVIIKNLTEQKQQKKSRSDAAFNPFAEDHMW